MKKLIAILLVLVMVLPMCFVTNAAGEDVGVRPFYLINTDRNVEEDEDNIYPKIFFWSQTSDKYVTEDSIKVSVPGVGGTTPKEIAENLKPVFDEYPDGTRYLRFGSVGSALKVLVEDWVYMEKGAAVMNAWFTEFIEHYRSIGGKLDGLVVDLEYFELSNYYVNQEAQKDMYIYYRIVENPNYATKIRPQLVERGFKFWPKVTEETPEIYSISEASGAEYALSRAIWNVVLRNHINKYIEDALLEPLLKNYPEDIKNEAKAWAAAGSDARMSGCEMPVVICSGSGNQGMTTSLPVVRYAKHLGVDHDKMLRAVVLSDLVTIHQKSGIGRLSAYCGAISAGVGAGAGIAYLLDGTDDAIAHTIVNAVAILSGTICDGAKPSCAAKIASAVDAGILGYEMWKNGDEFKGGDGIVTKGVDATIANVGVLAKEGMQLTDKVILEIMTHRCD